MDESDPRFYKKIKGEGEKTSSIKRFLSDASDVLSTVWIRRFIQTNNGHERILLDCRYSFLLDFRIFLVILYLSYEAFK